MPRRKLMRRKIFEIIESSDDTKISGKIYNIFMSGMITASLVPLMFKHDTFLFQVIDLICAITFTADYLVRLLTADYKYGEKSVTSFLRYPFSFLAIMDLISLLPLFAVFSDGFKILRMTRMIRTLKVFRAFRIIRHSKHVQIIVNVLKKSQESLAAVGVLTVGYIFICALVIFNAEPDSFSTFFDAVYWAAVSLTTIGYGDICPVTTIGRIITIVSALFGIAIIALPSGIITAGYMEEIRKK